MHRCNEVCDMFDDPYQRRICPKCHHGQYIISHIKSIQRHVDRGRRRRRNTLSDTITNRITLFLISPLKLTLHQRSNQLAIHPATHSITLLQTITPAQQHAHQGGHHNPQSNRHPERIAHPLLRTLLHPLLHAHDLPLLLSPTVPLALRLARTIHPSLHVSNLLAGNRTIRRTLPRGTANVLASIHSNAIGIHSSIVHIGSGGDISVSVSAVHE
mmetsp:Transcript_1889/g.4070  ORF Transcript_1889/g.4070 Transcript_1889/m.4070 type:complete len:214 (+) Transcript_1889:256-897(+)